MYLSWQVTLLAWIVPGVLPTRRAWGMTRSSLTVSGHHCLVLLLFPHPWRMSPGIPLYSSFQHWKLVSYGCLAYATLPFHASFRHFTLKLICYPSLLPSVTTRGGPYRLDFIQNQQMGGLAGDWRLWLAWLAAMGVLCGSSSHWIGVSLSLVPASNWHHLHPLSFHSRASIHSYFANFWMVLSFCLTLGSFITCITDSLPQIPSVTKLKWLLFFCFQSLGGLAQWES